MRLLVLLTCLARVTARAESIDNAPGADDQASASSRGLGYMYLAQPPERPRLWPTVTQYLIFFLPALPHPSILLSLAYTIILFPGSTPK